jgi:serine phosphatase RsbU (regulator of sigma subunit)
VDSRAASRQFSQRDLGLFAALAQHISIALENARLHVDSIEKVRLEQSLTIASAIQRDLMPPTPEGVAGWDLAAWYAPAEKAAGDFYDFARLKDGRQAVVVGDVAGHGIGPALITASAQGSLRSYLRLLSSPAEALTLLNQDLCERIEEGRFVTLLTAALRTDGEVEVFDAGHGEAIVWRAATRQTRPLGRGGPALGVVPGASYEVSERLRLDRGDALFLYSDGIAELPLDGKPDERVGEDGVAQAFARAAVSAAGAPEVLAHFREGVLARARAPYPDDITLVVVRRA